MFADRDGSQTSADGRADLPLAILTLFDPAHPTQQSVALPKSTGVDTSALALSQAHHMLKFVEVAGALLPAMSDLADHPGWVIMLQIFVANHEDRSVNRAALSDLTGCWEPLIARYVDMMIERGLVQRPKDGNATTALSDITPLHLTQDTDYRFQHLLCGFAQGWPEPPQG
jgi:hypothetical protein